MHRTSPSGLNGRTTWTPKSISIASCRCAGDDRGTGCVRGPGRGASSRTPIRDRAPASMFGGYHRAGSWPELPPQVPTAQSQRRHHISSAPVLRTRLAVHGGQYCDAKIRAPTNPQAPQPAIVVALRRSVRPEGVALKTFASRCLGPRLARKAAIDSGSHHLAAACRATPLVNQARATGEVRLDDEIRPYEAERLVVLPVNGRLRSNFVAARVSDTENCT
jgi:hypothetical protein